MRLNPEQPEAFDDLGCLEMPDGFSEEEVQRLSGR
jgi:hypothetical protein